MRYNSHLGTIPGTVLKLKTGGYTLLSPLPPFFKIERPRSTNLKKIEKLQHKV